MRRIAVGVGSFAVNKKVVDRLVELGCPGAQEELDRRSEEELNDPNEMYFLWRIKRDDPRLIRALEEIGVENAVAVCWGNVMSKIVIFEIPEGIEVYIEEDGESGCEWLAAPHKIWTYDSSENKVIEKMEGENARRERMLSY